MRKCLPALLLILVVSVSLCTAPPVPPTPTDNSTPPNSTEFSDIIYIPQSMEISREICAARGIEGKVLVMHSAGCGACAVAVPILEELEAELGTDFEFLDLSVPEQAERVQELKIIPYYVPTTIIDCYALVGVHSKDTYKERIEAI